jgi:hypothetical protein
VLRGRFIPSVHAAILGVLALTSVARAENTPPAGTLHEIPLRGGLRNALQAFGDRLPGDRSHFLVEVIRRVYDAPVNIPKNLRQPSLQALLAQLDRTEAGTEPVETVPLPLAPKTWIDRVFGGTADANALVSAILRSRNASLLYCGLLSLDDPTRAWLESQPGLLTDLATLHASSFVVAAAGLRIKDDAVQVPGGEAAVAAWQALVGREPRQAADFVRALLTVGEGRLAYFYGAMAELSPTQVRFALRLDATDPAVRVDAARRLFAVFDRVAGIWKVPERVFWRPTLDPALLAVDLSTNADGSPRLPGTRAFWSAAFEALDGPRLAPTGAAARALASDHPVDFAWLCEQIFKGGATVQRQPYEMALFASRVIAQVTPENSTDALDAVRAVATYPALVFQIERAQITDVAVYGAAVRRAHRLAEIDESVRQHRVLAQFQGSLALLTRAAQRKSLSPDTLSALIVSLSKIELNHRGEYGGRVARWWIDTIEGQAKTPVSQQPSPAHDAAWIGEPNSQRYQDAVGSLDRDVVRMLAGTAPVGAGVVDWEGMRYRVDLAWGEGTRIGRLLGDRAKPYLSSAAALVTAADVLTRTDSAGDTVREQVARTEQALNVVAWPETDKFLAPLRRAAQDARSLKERDAIVSPLLTVADDLLARGLTDLVYAVAFGHADRALIEAGDAAKRHDFGLRLFGRLGAWRYPIAGSDRLRDWRVTGSLLGLDVRLADFAIVRVSSRPPSARPTLNEADRRVLIEAVALMQSTSLTDADRDGIVGAIYKGRARLAAARTPEDAATVADEIRLNPTRRTLLIWTSQYDPERVTAALSPVELFWLGLETKPVARALHVWGASAEPRLGCLCLQLPDRRPLEALAGRWESGIFASGFADLNLRLAELLADMKMPAPLLASVLAPATADLIDSAVIRGQDDRRGLIEFVHALKADRLELYLALLTTDGPLVSLGETPAGDAIVGKTEGSR